MAKRAITGKHRTSVKQPSAQRRVVSHKRVLAAARRAVRQALKDHKAEGQPIVVWRDGKVVKVPASEIEV